MNYNTFRLIGRDEPDGPQENRQSRRLACQIENGGKLAIRGSEKNANNIHSVLNAGFPCAVHCQWRQPAPWAIEQYGHTHAENNLDFRLGTGPLRGTGVARRGDVAAIARVAESSYELRIFRQNTAIASRLASHAVNFIGNRGKRYGFISNGGFRDETGARIR